MKIWIEKELFQWEKDREVFVRTSALQNKKIYLQFYNSKSEVSKEIPLEGDKAKIPDSLLKECLPIMVLACVGQPGNTQVLARKEFKVLRRAKPENYQDDDESGSEIPDGVREIIYDGGEEI